LILDSETKPINVDKNLTISIFDVTQNKIYQLVGQSAPMGVYSGDFQTSVQDESGIWEIEAQYKETVKIFQFFFYSKIIYRLVFSRKFEKPLSAPSMCYQNFK
jgi:hypothetical protein